MLRVQAWSVAVGLAITGTFVVWPNPYLMALFAFFAQPLLLLSALLYARRVFRELRGKEVL